jgi:hypothetical protein
MKKIYDAVATVGKYTDQQGNEKKRYVTIGAVFEGDDGRLSMKLESIPVGPSWSGWVSFYEPRQGAQGTTQRQGGQSRPAPAESRPSQSASSIDR